MPVALNQFLIVSTLVLGAGIFAVVTRRNLIGALIGIELMLNSVTINLVAFSRFSDRIAFVEGQLIVVFIMALAVAEAAVGLAIAIALFRRFGSPEPETADTMKG